MMNTIYIALYYAFIISLINNASSVSITDMERSIKSLEMSSSLLIDPKNKNFEINNLELNSKNKYIINQENIIPSNSLKQKQFSLSECDMITDGPICLLNGDRIFLPSAKPKNLIGYWSFDETTIMDDSGNNNHAINEIKAGPAFGGIGMSAFFSEGNYLEVPHSKVFESPDFTITFWFYLMKHSNDEILGLKLCPIVQKGLDNLFNKSYNRFPSIFYDRKDRNFKIYAKTNLEELNEGESFFSNARVTYDKWLHISLTKKEQKLFFYVNGILDSKFDLKGAGIYNYESLFIGGTPLSKDQCKFDFLIDEMRFYNNCLEKDYIQAEASPALGNIEPNFIQLGCFNCGIKDAAISCVDGYKICSSIEMHTAGYQISRAMGWLHNDAHIWTHSALANENEFEGLKGIALCCAEIK